jgi:hypothetical protein
MNLTALKPRKDNRSHAEESDKSLAILVNLLKDKGEEARVKGHDLQVIEEIQSAKPDFNQVVRLNEGKNLLKKQRKTAEPRLRYEEANINKIMNFKKKKNMEANQRKITFESKPVIDKQTQLIALPFQKIKTPNHNLIMDKKRLLSHLRKKKNHKDEHVVQSQRGVIQTLNDDFQTKKKRSYKKSLSPTCAMISKLRQNKLKELKNENELKKVQSVKKRERKSQANKKNLVKIDPRKMEILLKRKTTRKTSNSKTKRPQSKKR